MATIENLTIEEDIVKYCLEDWGFTVDKIPEDKGKRPDFHVSKQTDRYLIEVKVKEPSKDFIRRRDEYLRTGKVFDETHTIIRQSGLTKKVSEGKAQLIAYEPIADYFRLIWFVLRGHNSDQIKEVLKANLFGKTHVCDWSAEGSNNLIECFYFSESDFFRYKEVIDGAVILTTNMNEDIYEAELWINDHSLRYEKFKSSLLYKKFGAAVIDAVELDKTEDYYLVDSDVDRSNKQAVLNYLKEKYSLSDMTSDMDMKYASGTVLVPNDP